MFEAFGSLASGQGPLFWGAAAAAALGAALLSAALVLHLRRLRPRFRLPVLRRRAQGRAAPVLARVVPGGYAPARPSPVAPAAAAQAVVPDLDPLLARLRRASDRLASLQADTGDSRLKATPARTEQLYRRGVG